MDLRYVQPNQQRAQYSLACVWIKSVRRQALLREMNFSSETIASKSNLLRHSLHHESHQQQLVQSRL